MLQIADISDKLPTLYVLNVTCHPLTTLLYCVTNYILIKFADPEEFLAITQ